MIRLVLVEDHHIVRDGIKYLLEKEEDIEVVEAATNGREALEMIARTDANIILTDWNMPEIDGRALLEEVKTIYPEKKIVVLSMFDHENYVLDAIKSGASGYLLKNICKEELLFALRHVAAGKTYVCSEVTYKILSRLSPSTEDSPAEQKLAVDLSKREIEVLTLMAEGYTNNEIAEKLFTSKRTIEGHRQNLIDKTGVRNTAALIRFAVRQGIIE